MADTDARGSAASTESHVIVADDFLHFLAVKMSTLSHEEIIQSALRTFDPEWIRSSTKVLFDLCPPAQQRVSHEGPLRHGNNIKDCLTLMTECGDDSPRFVSSHSHELSPVARAQSVPVPTQQLYTCGCAARSDVKAPAGASDLGAGATTTDRPSGLTSPRCIIRIHVKEKTQTQVPESEAVTPDCVNMEPTFTTFTVV